MKPAPHAPNEPTRLKSLREHQILDTLPEEVYDEITGIATEICGAPIALLTFVDEERQWFKSKQGIELTETCRETSFCAHAILNPDEPLIINDARYDERFHDNPLTIGDTKIVFYAGVPVKDENGLALGSLCVIDHRPRELSDKSIEALKALAKLVGANLKLRKSLLENEELKSKLTGAKEQASIIRREAQELQGEENLKDNKHLEGILKATDMI